MMSSSRVDFFLIGVQKGGTTALATHFQKQPTIQMARVKEVHYFDDEFGGGLELPHP